MSTEEDKIKHSKRLHKEEAAIKRQVKIAKAFALDEEYTLNYEQGRFSKRHAVDSHINPRRHGEETIQEKRFKQAQLELDLNPQE